MGCTGLLQLRARPWTLGPTAPWRNGAAVMTDSPLLLALHSCTERFGVAVQDPLVDQGRMRVMGFDDGRSLSNSLIERVVSLVPNGRWREFKGLAVATGPGGFTGTRLSVVMARTLAQQLGCPLLGVSSFALMAQRLAPDEQPFWITQPLPRRGVVAGEYRVRAAVVEERQAPHLLKADQLVRPAVEAVVDVDADVATLLGCLQLALQRDEPLPWQPVLPIYPTSPVGPV